MDTISTILDNTFLVISVVGVHAGEPLAEIFIRKQGEIDKIGKSFWLIKSFRAKTDDIQRIGLAASEIQQEIYCIFIAPAQTEGAKPTSSLAAAKQYSENGSRWLNVPDEIHTTGKINTHSTCLVLGSLDLTENNMIDLWEYSDFREQEKAITLSRGASTVCAVKKHREGMKSRMRGVVGFGRLVFPYAVYIK